MKKIILFLLCTVSTIVIGYAQESEKILKPILLDKSALSGVGLERIKLKDEPTKEFYQKRLFWGKDLGVFVVSTQTWVNKITDYPFDEFVFMYQGEAVTKPKIGSAQVFYSGQFFFAPKGFNGEWEIRGGNHLHYELSVITTKRSDSSLVKTNPRHTLFNKSTLSGNSIHLSEEGTYEEVLKEGVELTVRMMAEKPKERKLDTSKSERLIHLLSGQVKIIDASKQEHLYYSGDFFIVPKGCAGTWKSEGHQLVKYLTVEKTT